MYCEMYLAFLSMSRHRTNGQFFLVNMSLELTGELFFTAKIQITSIYLLSSTCSILKFQSNQCEII